MKGNLPATYVSYCFHSPGNVSLYQIKLTRLETKPSAWINSSAVFISIRPGW